jgi:hypothetical protein
LRREEKEKTRKIKKQEKERLAKKAVYAKKGIFCLLE